MPTGWTDLPLELRSRILDISLNSVVKDALTNAWMNHVTELQSKRITEEDLSWLGYVSHSFGMDSLPILDEIHKHLVTEHGNFEGKCRVEDMKSQNKRGETTHVPSDDICRFAVVCGYKRAVEEVLKIIESRNAKRVKLRREEDRKRANSLAAEAHSEWVRRLARASHGT